MKALIVLFSLLLCISLTQAQPSSLRDLVNRGYSAVMKYNFESGISNMNRGNYRAAIRDFTSCINGDPTNSAAYYNRGVCKARLGDAKSSLSDFTSAIKHNPRLGEAYLNRGLIKAALGNYKGGCSDLRKASSLGVYCDDLITRYCY